MLNHARNTFTDLFTGTYGWVKIIKEKIPVAIWHGFLKHIEQVGYDHCHVETCKDDIDPIYLKRCRAMPKDEPYITISMG